MIDLISQLHPKPGDLLEYLEEFFIYLRFNNDNDKFLPHLMLNLNDMYVDQYQGSVSPAIMIKRFRHAVTSE